MLNSVLLSAKEAGMFKAIGKEKKIEFLKEVVNIGDEYDCNPGEIFEDLKDDIDICYGCLEESEALKDGLCPKCYGESDEDEDDDDDWEDDEE